MLALISLRYNGFLGPMSCSPTHAFLEPTGGVRFLPVAPTQDLGAGTGSLP